VDKSQVDVLILCGGLGTRLRSVVGEKPKVMADINGRPFLDILLDFFKQQGSTRIILCTGYKSEDIEDYYRNYQGLSVEFSREEEPLGTGGAIKQARSLIKSNPFLACNGDCFCNLDLATLLDFHESRQAVATDVVTKVKEAKDFGVISLAADDQITGFKEKMASSTEHVVNAGLYCFDQKVFDLMPAEKKFSLEEDFFPSMVGQGFYGFVVDTSFYDIGTPDRLKKAEEQWKKKDE